MSRKKTEIEVVISSQFENTSLVVKHDIKGRDKHMMRPQPSSRTADSEKPSASNHTPASTPRAVSRRNDFKTGTPKTGLASGSQTATPRTPLIFDGTPKTPGISNTTTPSSVALSRTNTPGVGRTPLLPSGSKTPLTNTPRHGVPLPKRFRRDEENSKPVSATRLGVQRSRSIRDAELRRKDDDGKRKETHSRVLSTSSLNVSSPRVSGNRLSAEPKTPISTKSSANRSSLSKSSLGSSTPITGSGRRSRASLSRYSSLLSEPPQSLVGNSGGFLTPDIANRRRSSVLPVSPCTDENFDGAESTAVSVGVRIRPLNNREKALEVKNIVEVASNTVTVTNENGAVHNFNYDHCFWSCDEFHPMYATQQSVYNALARPLLDKSYEGYNVCLFAYGQTGSGKSFTMLGEDTHEDPEAEAGEAAGIIPRFCREFFLRADYLHSQNPPEEELPQCRLEVEVSYIEIYNERIYDLLSSGGCSGDRREALRVREHPVDGPYVEGVARHLVSSYNHLQTWLLLGNKERSIAATGMNDKSSRSHAVFTLRLKQMQVEDVEGERLESSRVSIINLVDLAGSERVAAAQSQGDRLKEGVCINKSLLTLGKVITALAESAGRKRTFIPYRESVLTYLLKESLGGNSRTAMIATISPSNVHMEETLSTLRYAQQARKIVNRNHINEDPTARIIRSLKEEVERLRRQQIIRSPSMLSEAEVSNDYDKEEDEDEKEKERELALQEVEKEKDRAIKEKEEIISSLKEQLQLQYQLQMQQLSEKTRTFEQRLKETEERQQEALENQRLMGIASQEEKGPQLINLSKDPQLSETLSYKLKEGTTNIGRSHCDLILHGLHSSSVHCSIFNEDGCLNLFPKSDADTYINGVLITSPSALHHNDRLVLAGTYYFRVNIPADDTELSRADALNLDFYYTEQELLKEQEKRLREEAEAVLAASKAELERQMCDQRDQLMEEVKEAQNQLLNKHQMLVEMEGTQWKLEEEKRLLEEQILRDRKVCQSLDVSLQSPPFFQSNFLQEVEAIFNESMQEVRRDHTITQPNLSLRIKEANQICKRLKKNYEFMIQEVLNECGLEIVVLVKDLSHHMTATLTLNVFTQKLHILRDMVKGEEGEDVNIEMGMIWERTEDVNCVPAFINKLRDSNALATFNSSFNCSINSSFAHNRSNKRRSSILCPDRSALFGSGGGVVSSSGSVAVASAIHRTLMSLPTFDPSAPFLTSAFNAVLDFHNIIQSIREHITEPGLSLPDEEFSEYLVRLLSISQITKSALMTVVETDIKTNCIRCNQLQEKIRKRSTRMNSSTSRLFQGIKSDVESLVEEETRTLLTATKEIAKDIAQLALMAPLPMPDITNIDLEGEICKKFAEGLRSGLDWLVKQCADSANEIKDFTEDTVAVHTSTHKQVYRAEIHSATAAIAGFLRKFGHLDAAFDFSGNVSKEEQSRRLREWVARVESAADTITELNAALKDLSQQAKLKMEDVDYDKLEGAVEELKTRLEKLMCFAGLGPKNSGGLENCSFSSNASLEDSGVFMDSLTNIAWRSVHAIESLQNAINNMDAHPATDSLKVGSSSKFKAGSMLGHWPTNSKEYMELRKVQLNKQKSPFKSSLRSSASVPGEEKRVRFNVSASPSPRNSEEEDC